MELNELITEIFYNIPKPECSIRIEFDNPDVDDPTKFVFEQLVMIFTEGMKILYGDYNGNVDLSTITIDDFEKIREYFKSFGFDIKYKITPIDYYNPIKNDNVDKLSDHFLRLNKNELSYFISFDNYIV